MNHLTLAVAGGGKTQSIIDSCTTLSDRELTRTLALTYTRTGQRELTTRLRLGLQPRPTPKVTGWYSFLLSHIVRPYLPRRLAGERVRGFNFHGDPGRYASGRARFLDDGGRAYRRHLAKLAVEVMEVSGGGPVDRLVRMYDHIYIDEVQDLVGWDLEVLDALLECDAAVHAVGDIRQSLLETNPQDAKNKQYRGLQMADWFRSRDGLPEHQSVTHRSNQAIATFADSIFGPEHGFPPTRSSQKQTTGHDGVFAVLAEHLDVYVDTYQCQCLRHSRASAKGVALAFRNFGEVKGLTFPRVLIYPTTPITKFLTGSQSLDGRSACGFYVALTRAKYSVAIVLSERDVTRTSLPVWRPSAGEV